MLIVVVVCCTNFNVNYTSFSFSILWFDRFYNNPLMKESVVETVQKILCLKQRMSEQATQRKELLKLSKSELISRCNKNKLSTSGTSMELANRIISHSTKKSKKLDQFGLLKRRITFIFLGHDCINSDGQQHQF